MKAATMTRTSNDLTRAGSLLSKSRRVSNASPCERAGSAGEPLSPPFRSGPITSVAVSSDTLLTPGSCRFPAIGFASLSRASATRKIQHFTSYTPRGSLLAQIRATARRNGLGSAQGSNRAAPGLWHARSRSERNVIISRAPVRFSLGGGGTDLPSYYQRYGGYVVSAAIDKYVYVTANKRFYDDIRLAYSETEIVPNVESIRHRIFREALRMTGIDRAIELTSVADEPANSGLG
jgi:hypothetical protein